MPALLLSLLLGTALAASTPEGDGSEQAPEEIGEPASAETDALAIELPRLDETGAAPPADAVEERTMPPSDEGREGPEPSEAGAVGTSGSNASGSQAEDGGMGGAIGDAPSAYGVVLAKAKALYFDGQAEDAQALLRELQVRLLLGEAVSPEQYAETLVWLGEIQYRLGRSDDAREAFRLLLQRDPEYPISPYAHPIEVVGEFELVRREVQADLDPSEEQLPPALPAVLPPAPSWVWAPLGVPQFAQRRVGAGLALGGLQLGLGAAALGMHAHLRSINPEPGSSSHPLGWSADESLRRVQTQRYLVQWPLTFAFYGVWLASSLEARGHWRSVHRERTTLGLGALPGGGSGVVVTRGF